jgi:membrane protein CcdC involved in cytochrome C biogenesis
MTGIPGTSFGAAIVGFFVVLAWRIREGQTPVTVKKVVIPPLGMATGFSMFLVPIFRVPWTWAISAFLLGALVLAYPLIRTSRLTRQGEVIMMHRSKAFFAVIAVLALIRLAARRYVNRVVSLEQTAGLFFVLAFGMILSWRISMLLEYRRLTGD